MNPLPTCPAELQPFLADLIDPDTSDVDYEKLEALLRVNADARAYYLHYMQLHAELQLLAESPLTSPLSAHPSAIDESDAAPSPRDSGWWLRLIHLTPSQIAVLMALLFISAGLAVLAVLKIPATRASRPADAAPAAQLVATHECVWAGDGLTPEVRRRYRVGELLELESGQAEFVFADGAELVLAGPARVRLGSAGSCTLELGQAMAEVPARASGFTIHTPTAAIVDLGTSFAVSVDTIGVTEVHVFQGSVAVQPGGDQDDEAGGAMRQLAAGAALQIDQSRTFRSIDCDPARFVRHTPNVAHLPAHQGGGLLCNDRKVLLGGNNRGVRRIGASSGAGVALASVLLFRLPDIEDAGDIESARLIFAYKSMDGAPDFAVDLYGLGYVPSAAVSPSWFYEGDEDAKSPADYGTGTNTEPVMRLAQDVITPQTRVGRVVTQNQELADFIASLYRDGAAAGDLAVFRLNANTPTQQTARMTGFNIVHGPAVVGHTQHYEIPVLTIFTSKPSFDRDEPVPLPTKDSNP